LISALDVTGFMALYEVHFIALYQHCIKYIPQLFVTAFYGATLPDNMNSILAVNFQGTFHGI